MFRFVLPHLYLHLELGPLYLDLGRIPEEVAEEPEEAPDLTLADRQYPMPVDAPRPGFRIIGDGAEIVEDGPR